MKLYYSPGSCAMAPHIVANEAEIPVELIRVDLASKKTEKGDDYFAVNPHGYVPTLTLDDGQTLTEASLLVQYLGDLKPETGLIPAAGTMERYRVQQALVFISTELHKSFSPFFKPGTPEDTKTANRALLGRRVEQVDRQLADRTFLTGETFTVADAYLFTILNWAKFANLDLSGFPNVQRFMAAVAARPAVQKTRQEQGLA